ncbi:30S ribosome-binding factor RbfA [Buchnera aphidicola (Mollitrichosiphum nigrofasciatum)]|uniref:30S ribosome-binding factor RbfA n=1 Tax=Buchnera aphidicola TaxID=9 RepID=UPI0031B89BA7
MKNVSNRFLRISKEFKKNISNILHMHIQDPRIRCSVSISKVYLSKNLQYAKVFVIFIGNKSNFSISSLLTLLKNASKYFCFMLSKFMYLRIMPNLVFFYDYDFFKSIRISNLINNAIQEDVKKKKKYNNF